jgi:hypothetical protein
MAGSRNVLQAGETLVDGRMKGMALSPTDLIASLALLVACVAAWTTWRIHKDSGGRVQVRMNAAAYFP